LYGLQIRILLMLYISSANCEQRKLATANRNNAVDHKRNYNSGIMLWITKEIKMQLQVLQG